MIIGIIVKFKGLIGNCMSRNKESNHNNDDNNLEKKQWMLNVLASLLQDSYDELNSAKQEWVIKFREAYPVTLTTNRNRILASIAFVIGVLFSLNDFLSIGSLKNVFLIMIVGLLAYALLVYVLNSRGVKKVTTAVNNIELGYYMPQTRLLILKGYLSGKSLHPEELKVSDLDDFTEFTYFFNMNRVELVKAFKDAAKDTIFDKDKPALEQIVQGLEQNMRDACSQYEKKFNSSHVLVGKLFYLIEPMVKAYGSSSKPVTT